MASRSPAKMSFGGKGSPRPTVSGGVTAGGGMGTGGDEADNPRDTFCRLACRAPSASAASRGCSYPPKVSGKNVVTFASRRTRAAAASRAARATPGGGGPGGTGGAGGFKVSTSARLLRGGDDGGGPFVGLVPRRDEPTPPGAARVAPASSATPVVPAFSETEASMPSAKCPPPRVDAPRLSARDDWDPPGVDPPASWRSNPEKVSAAKSPSPPRLKPRARRGVAARADASTAATNAAAATAADFSRSSAQTFALSLFSRAGDATSLEASPPHSSPRDFSVDASESLGKCRFASASAAAAAASSAAGRGSQRPQNGPRSSSSTRTVRCITGHPRPISARSFSGDAGPRWGHRGEFGSEPEEASEPESEALRASDASSFDSVFSFDDDDAFVRTRSPLESAGSLREFSSRRADPLGNSESAESATPPFSVSRGERSTVTLCLRCVAGVIDTSSACSRPPGVAGADGKRATRRCLAVFPKNSRRTRAARKSHESERVDISRSAPSFAAASFRALRMRAAFPCDTLLPRLLEGRSGSITFRCLMGMRTCAVLALSATFARTSPTLSASLAAPGPVAPRELAACCRMMDSLPYLSSMRHMNSRVRSSSSAPSSSSPLAVPFTRSAMRTGPCMLTACVSQSNSANVCRNVCRTSSGVVSDLER